MNTVAFWKFHGWTSLESQQRKQHELRRGMPRIEMEPGMRTMGIDSWNSLR